MLRDTTHLCYQGCFSFPSASQHCTHFTDWPDPWACGLANHDTGSSGMSLEELGGKNSSFHPREAGWWRRRPLLATPILPFQNAFWTQHLGTTQSQEPLHWGLVTLVI